MKAIILAAGIGTRMGEISKNTPKCLIKVGNKSIIEYQIEALKFNNINDISVVIGYFAEKVKSILKNASVKFYPNHDYEKTGMLESMYCAKEELNGNLILLYGDIIFKADLIKKLLEDKNDFCLVVDRQKEIEHEAEEVFEQYHGEKIKKGSTKVNIINGIVKKISKDMPPEESSAEYIGIAKFSKKGLMVFVDRVKELIGNGEIKKYPSPSHLFSWLINNGYEIHVVYTDGLVYEEMDYLDDLEKAKAKFVNL